MLFIKYRPYIKIPINNLRHFKKNIIIWNKNLGFLVLHLGFICISINILTSIVDYFQLPSLKQV